jgi:uncharacterized FlaG/YvyC family protein
MPKESIAREVARGKAKLAVIEANWEKARSGNKECSTTYFNKAKAIRATKVKKERDRIASLTPEQREQEKLAKYMVSINTYVKSLNAYQGHTYAITKAMDILCKTRTAEESREILGIQKLYEAKYELLDLQKHIQSLMPDEVTVSIHSSSERLEIIADDMDEVKKILRYHGYKYTIKYGCVMTKTYCRKYEIDEEATKRLLAILGHKEYIIESDIILYIPKCYEDKVRKVIGTIGVRSYYKPSLGIWVNAYTKRKTISQL